MDARKKIWLLLNHPDKLMSGDDLQLIAGQLDRYPYFQPLHFLKAYKVFRTSRQRSMKYMSRLAAYTPDRTVLYHRFNIPVDDRPAARSLSSHYTPSPEQGVKSGAEASDAVLSGQIADPAGSSAAKQTLTGNADQEEFRGNFLEWLEHMQYNQLQKEKKPGRNSGITGKPDKTQQLIDNFIERQPMISRTKKEIYSAENMARKSVLEDEGMVSETLAQIHSGQGNYDRAIRIYEQLTMVNPGNVHKFAEQIKRLKALKNKK